MSKKVVIIGAGIGGLATACLLGRAGYEVTLVEKNSFIGGRTGQIKADGFVFDSGPSWLLMPDVFEHFFKLFDQDVKDVLKLQKLSPSYQVFFKDTLLGSAQMSGNAKQDSATFESFEPGAKQQLASYLEVAAEKYRLSTESFIYRNYRSPLDLLRLKNLPLFRRLQPFTSLDQHVRSYFASPELQKILLYPALFLGTEPSKLPATYSLLNHVDFHEGVYYPAGGLYSLVGALEAIASAQGVTIKTNCEASRIKTQDGRVAGVITAAGNVDADIVVSNAPLEHTEQYLLVQPDRAHTRRYWKERDVAPGALLIYLGVKGSYPRLSHHNLVFSKDWEASLAAAFSGKKLPEDPSFYVCNPSKTDSSVAPKNHENMFVLVPIPARTDYTSHDLEAFSDKILTTMEQSLHLTDLRKNIVYKTMRTPLDFSNDFNAYRGSMLGYSHVFRQSGPFRESNQHPKVRGLYYAGAETTPGIGLPMCLISAELVYKRLAGDRSSGPIDYIKTLV